MDFTRVLACTLLCVAAVHAIKKDDGCAYWDQDVSTQSDAQQDDLMDATCANTFGSSYRAMTVGELDIQVELPTNNMCDVNLLGKCPDCEGDAYSTAVSNHKRLCVPDKKKIKKSGGEWVSNCASGTRAAHCVVTEACGFNRWKTCCDTSGGACLNKPNTIRLEDASNECECDAHCHTEFLASGGQGCCYYNEHNENCIYAFYKGGYHPDNNHYRLSKLFGVYLYQVDDGLRCGVGSNFSPPSLGQSFLLTPEPLECTLICDEYQDCKGFNYVKAGEVYSGGPNYAVGDGACYFRMDTSVTSTDSGRLCYTKLIPSSDSSANAARIFFDNPTVAFDSTSSASNDPFGPSSASNDPFGPSSANPFQQVRGVRWAVAGVGLGLALILLGIKVLRRRRGVVEIPSISEA